LFKYVWVLLDVYVEVWKHRHSMCGTGSRLQAVKSWFTCMFRSIHVNL